LQLRHTPSGPSALVIAPGTRIRGHLGNDLRSNSATNFYERCAVFPAHEEFQEATIIATGRVNLDDIRHWATLGIMHEGINGSSKFIFDLMEPERPKVDRAVLDFVKKPCFRSGRLYHPHRRGLWA
jgi:hypothetical protein